MPFPTQKKESSLKGVPKNLRQKRPLFVFIIPTVLKYVLTCKSVHCILLVNKRSLVDSDSQIKEIRKKIMSLKKVAARSAHLDKCKLADAIKGQQIGKLSMLMPTPRPMKPQKRITPVDAPISPTMGTFQSQPGSIREKINTKI